MSSNTYINPNASYFKGIFDDANSLSITSGDKRYVRISSDAALRSLTLSDSLFMGGSLSTNTILSTSITSTGLIESTRASGNGQMFRTVNGTSTCSLFQFRDGIVQFGTSTAHDLILMTNNGGRVTIDASGAINAGTNSLTCGALSCSSLTVGGQPVTSFTGVITPTTRTIGTHTNVIGVVFNTSSSRFFGQQQLNSESYSLLSYSAGGNYTSYLTWNHNSGSPIMLSQGAFEAPDIHAYSTQANSSTAECFSFGHGTESRAQWYIENFRDGTNPHFSLKNRFQGDNLGINVGMWSSLGASGGAMMILNGAGGDGVFITCGTSASNGSVHLNCGIQQAVPSGWGYTPSGQASAAGGTVATSLYCHQNVWVRGSVFCTSDGRLKDVISDLDSEKAMKLLQIKPKWYKWKGDVDGLPQLGLLAQDLVKHDLKDLVLLMDNDSLGEDPEGLAPPKKQMTVAYDRLSLYLLEIAKRQQQKITALEEIVQRLIDLLPKTKKNIFESL